MSNIGLALQLYTLRKEAAENLEDTLKKVHDTGFEYVQWSGMPDIAPEIIREMLDKSGLKAIAGHYPLEAFEKDIEDSIAYWHIIGAPDVAVGSMPKENQSDIRLWDLGAQRLESVGARLRSHGLRFSYHNHAFELACFDGSSKTKLDRIFIHTRPAHVHAELDIAWLQIGGANPADMLRKYAGRCPVIHVKDLTANATENNPEFVPLGHGIMDWESVFDAGEEAGVEWYVYEQDTVSENPFEDVRISYDFLSTHA